MVQSISYDAAQRIHESAENIALIGEQIRDPLKFKKGRVEGHYSSEEGYREHLLYRIENSLTTILQEYGRSNIFEPVAKDFKKVYQVLSMIENDPEYKDSLRNSDVRIQSPKIAEHLVQEYEQDKNLNINDVEESIKELRSTYESTLAERLEIVRKKLETDFKEIEKPEIYETGIKKESTEPKDKKKGGFFGRKKK